MRSTKFWVILVGAMLVVCLGAAVAVLGAHAGSSTARVYQDGALLYTIDLSQVEEGYTFSVEGPAGVNTIQVEPGRIRVAAADCPDQVCVHQGWISNGVTPIVCLPNRLTIRIENPAQGGEVDGVTG